MVKFSEKKINAFRKFSRVGLEIAVEIEPAQPRSQDLYPGWERGCEPALFYDKLSLPQMILQLTCILEKSNAHIQHMQDKD